MDASFWHGRWENNQTGFHERVPNPLLIQYFDELALSKGSRVFLPLCGKTLDIAWLLANGYRVAGAELSELAIQQLFEELGVAPTVSPVGMLKHFRAEDIDLFVGDIFELSPTVLGPVDALYDRAALVALPEAMRRRYTSHLIALTNMAPQLLITLEYDQGEMAGPPFSLSGPEIRRHYGERYLLTHRKSVQVPGGLKGKCAAKEHAWLLNHG